MAEDDVTTKALTHLFPVSDGRLKAAKMFLEKYDYWPSSEEIKTITEASGLMAPDGWSILDTLQQAGLFTKEDGSITLLRKHLHDQETAKNNATTPIGDGQVPNTAQLKSNLNVNARATNEENPSSVATDPPGEPESKAIDDTSKTNQTKKTPFSKRTLDTELALIKETQFAFETRMEAKVGRLIDEIKNSLSVTTPTQQTPTPIKAEPTPTIQPERSDSPTTPAPRGRPRLTRKSEEQAQPIRTLIEDADEEAIKKMSREELEEIATDALQGNPETPPRLEGRSPYLRENEQTANTESLRKIIIQVTPFTLAAFDKAREGGFDGNLSDFVNSTVQKYLEDRGYTLVWAKVDPMTKQLIPPWGARNQ